EPTGGLDPLMQEEFLALVGEERDRGAAVFLSSHELDEVQRVCDRVGIVRGGRLIAVERVADLLGKARRRFTVELRDPAGLERLRELPGVSDFELAGGRAAFTATGDLDAVVRELAGHHVVDLEATHPSLEEVFLGYYDEAGALP
ncbi:MAG TPA: ABC transporter ATP-binding protein, partial [Solirubrobacterales bacterium]|nr:ABC transporter ATP-binding protein [Solirubrobacterales bacterium]